MNTMTMDPKEYAALLYTSDYSFEEFEDQWPNLAASEYGEIVQAELERLVNADLQESLDHLETRDLELAACESPEYPTFEKACRRLLDSVWTMTFVKVGPQAIEILAYNRDDSDGYNFEYYMPHCKLQEDGDRIVRVVTIAGTEYTVENPKHIFKY